MFTAISLWQPWASLWVLGEKIFETRSWTTNYRGLLLVQAAKRIDQEVYKLVMFEPFRTALKADPYWSLKRGKVIGAVNLTDCILIAYHPEQKRPFPKLIGWPDEDNQNELAFGNWEPGRFAWRAQERVVFPEPFYCQGRQGLFNVPERHLVLATELWDKHPEWWQGPCTCKACRNLRRPGI